MDSAGQKKPLEDFKQRAITSCLSFRQITPETARGEGRQVWAERDVLGNKCSSGGVGRLSSSSEGLKMASRQSASHTRMWL